MLGGCSQWLCQDKTSSARGVASLSTLHAPGRTCVRSVLMEVGGLTRASRGSCWLSLLRSPRTCCSPEQFGFQTRLLARRPVGCCQRRACCEQTPGGWRHSPFCLAGHASLPPCVSSNPVTHRAASLLLPPAPLPPGRSPPDARWLWCHPQAILFYQNNSC